MALGIGLASLAETFTGGPEGHLVNLTVALDYVDGITVPVYKESNAFGTGISAHLGGASLELFNKF